MTARPEPVTTRRAFDDSDLPGLPEPLPRPVIDSHTHTDCTVEYSGLHDELSLALAREVGVERVVQVGCDVTSSRYAVALAGRHAEVVAAVAIHPNDAARLTGGRRRGDAPTFGLASGDESAEPDNVETGAKKVQTGPDRGERIETAFRPGVLDTAALDDAIAEIDALAARPGVRAIGETGLDFYRTRDPLAQRRQRHSFAAHIAIAKKHGHTLVIHDRDAHEAILEVLDAEGAPERVVMHCFSGDAAFARQCVERGFWLSFPGVVTFGSADSLRDALAVVPLDRLLVETDAPYLTPKPMRGRPNAPYLLPHTVRFIAEQRGVDLAEFCDQVTANTFAAFGGPWPVGQAADV